MITAIILHYQLTNGNHLFLLPATQNDAADSVNFKATLRA